MSEDSFTPLSNDPAAEKLLGNDDLQLLTSDYGQAAAAVSGLHSSFWVDPSEAAAALSHQAQQEADPVLYPYGISLLYASPGDCVGTALLQSPNAATVEAAWAASQSVGLLSPPSAQAALASPLTFGVSSSAGSSSSSTSWPSSSSSSSSSGEQAFWSQPSSSPSSSSPSAPAAEPVSGQRKRSRKEINAEKDEQEAASIGVLSTAAMRQLAGVSTHHRSNDLRLCSHVCGCRRSHSDPTPAVLDDVLHTLQVRKKQRTAPHLHAAIDGQHAIRKGSKSGHERNHALHPNCDDQCKRLRRLLPPAPLENVDGLLQTVAAAADSRGLVRLSRKQLTTMDTVLREYKGYWTPIVAKNQQ